MMSFLQAMVSSDWPRRIYPALIEIGRYEIWEKKRNFVNKPTGQWVKMGCGLMSAGHGRGDQSGGCFGEQVNMGSAVCGGYQ